MARESNKLSALKIARLKSRGRHADGLGLYLQISESGSKAWLFRYQLRGRSHYLGLGPLHTVSLAEARLAALECRKLLYRGIDPLAAKRDQLRSCRLEEARSASFRECAERYVDAHKAGWKNAKHSWQWAATLENYVYPLLGDLDVSAIDTALVLKVLEPIWATKTETAARVRGRIESVLDWAAARGLRGSENPARWKGHLDKLLPARKKVAPVRHHSALPYTEIPAFMQDLRARQVNERTYFEGRPARQVISVSALCLEFVILTVCRTGEAIGATLEEFDRKTRIWTVPATRMKAGREHRVPLCDRVIEILDALPREAGNDFVFVGRAPGSALSNMALLAVLRDMDRGDITTHGFRSTFKDWAAERTSFPAEVSDMALAHVVGDKVEAAYRRGDLFDKRKRLAVAWGAYCTSPIEGKVVAIRERRHAQ